MLNPHFVAKVKRAFCEKRLRCSTGIRNLHAGRKICNNSDDGCFNQKEAAGLKKFERVFEKGFGCGRCSTRCHMEMTSAFLHAKKVLHRTIELPLPSKFYT
jgi:hypothetical protein